MKSVQMAVVIAAAVAMASVGFEARAQGITRAQCEAAALMAYNAGVQRCNSQPWWAQPSCRAYEYFLYNEQMGYCATLAIPVTTTKPGWLDGWFGF
jgi:hypothetical protein